MGKDDRNTLSGEIFRSRVLSSAEANVRNNKRKLFLQVYGSICCATTCTQHPAVSEQNEFTFQLNMLSRAMRNLSPNEEITK